MSPGVAPKSPARAVDGTTSPPAKPLKCVVRCITAFTGPRGARRRPRGGRPTPRRGDGRTAPPGWPGDSSLCKAGGRRGGRVETDRIRARPAERLRAATAAGDAPPRRRPTRRRLATLAEGIAAQTGEQCSRAPRRLIAVLMQGSRCRPSSRRDTGASRTRAAARSSSLASTPRRSRIRAGSPRRCRRLRSPAPTRRRLVVARKRRCARRSQHE